MTRLFLAQGVLLALVVSSGCVAEPKGAAPAAKVNGTVKMDGKLVPSGEIHFSIPGYPPRALEIQDGSYSGEAPIGKNAVEVYIFVEGPPIERYGGKRLRTNTTPSKYWGAETTLDATVEAGGANAFDFQLTSK